VLLPEPSSTLLLLQPNRVAGPDPLSDPQVGTMSEPPSCRGCSESLSGQTFIRVAEEPLCVTCYQRRHANTCQECKQLIGHDEKELMHQDRFFHENCFRCCSCNRSLATEPFTQQGGALLCSSCSRFSSRCTACSQSVQPGSRMLEYDGAAWHEDCFLCSGCRKPIGAEAFVPDAGRFYCLACYEQQVAPRCSHCRKVRKNRLNASLWAATIALTKGGLTYRGEVWHRDCFLCCGCGSPLAGQTFTSQGERPYCVRCFSSLYAKKCAACNAPITGFGDGKYVSFEERQWHQPCFKCSRCSVSLVGSGFFPDRDQILCADCNSDD
ncbi:hypothetical protein CCH79_00020148, partial [Gambusia affinis]